MVKYKQLWLATKIFYTEYRESDYLCPLCNSVIKTSLVDVICSNPNCKFEYSTLDFFEKYAIDNKYQKKELINKNDK